LGAATINRRTIFTLVALAFLLAANVVAAADKVIISYGSRSYAFLPAQIAVAKDQVLCNGLPTSKMNFATLPLGACATPGSHLARPKF
jgi:hypothetical protein